MVCFKQKYLVVTVLLFSFIFCLPNFACAASIRTVRVGYVPLSGYMNYDANGYRSGYGYEYLQELADYAGWKYEYIEGTWADSLVRLKSGQIDLLIGLADSPVRRREYDFSEASFGLNYAVLSVRAADDMYTSDDYHSLDGLTVGMLQGSFRNSAFEEFSKTHGFSIIPKLYPDEKSLIEALQMENINAIGLNNLRRSDAERIVASFAPLPFYAAVKKGDAGLLKELNDAMMELRLDDPQIESRLYQKYYVSNGPAALILSPEEKTYLRDKEKLVVIITQDQRPYSYFINADHKGIVGDLMKRFSKDIGIPLVYIQAKNEVEAVELLQQGKADIICDFIQDYGIAEHSGIKITFPYLELQYTALSKRGYLTDKPKVACQEGRFFNQIYVDKNYAKDDIQYYPTLEDCLDAVETGRADVTYLNSYTAQEILSESKYRNLQATLNPEFSHKVSMGINIDQNPILIKLLNREINHLGLAQVSHIINNNTLLAKRKMTMLDYVYENPVQIIVGSVLFFGTVILLLLGLLYMRKEHLAHVNKLAYDDELTGLKNLRWFEENMPTLIRENIGKKYAVISFDINRFDVINECYGRELGKKILRHIGIVLRRKESEDHIAVRSQGAHFICLLVYENREIFESDIKVLEQQFSVYEDPNTFIRLSVKLGIYLLQDNKMPITEAIDYAETACYEVKNSANSFMFFDERIKAELILHREIENHMEQALQNAEFEVYYQPKFNMQNNHMMGAEALVRWNSSHNGFLNPAQFIGVFEDNGFIIQLDFYVLEEVCKFINEQLIAGQHVVPISVNQSRLHLSEKDYLKKLKKLVQRYNIPAGSIELELTETAFADLQDVAESKAIFAAVKNLGFLTSMDDFGSGYSSLMLLNAISLDVLKLDRSFLAASEDSARTRDILEKIIEMGHKLKMQVICEGVETKEQANMLLSVNCLFAQGFLYARPMPQAKFKEFMEEQLAMF
ncbi:diguanylate cyclase (GGDEF) domain-containing protein [Propionispira arboris]|uniref:Diguanylate cyclase (GGDEF) domain-containing protein n=1 Tax=Propionispira arboris TaxID=84035 RepID=A0A1H7B7W9_9FIRM|nr:EAL domain-containing protein [Propionispira arboris]SEJ73803.1 diguanylate cyclase (GGDEF) domain-containing protein [Propionispira arboris]